MCIVYIAYHTLMYGITHVIHFFQIQYMHPSAFDICVYIIYGLFHNTRFVVSSKFTVLNAHLGSMHISSNHKPLMTSSSVIVHNRLLAAMAL